MRVRDRREDDLTTLVEIADAVRDVDRWPPHRVGPTMDLVAGYDPLAALVAEEGGKVVGQVLLHERSAGRVMALATESLGRPANDLAVVARLFVAPDHRRRGAARLLLTAALDRSRCLGRHAILDVWTELHGAIALYEAAGWRRLGEVSFMLRAPCGPDCLHGDGPLRSLVFAEPDGQ